MPISETVIFNVVNNVLHIMIGLFGVYVAMYVVEMITKFAAGAFGRIKIFDKFKLFNFKL